MWHDLWGEIIQMIPSRYSRLILDGSPSPLSEWWKVAFLARWLIKVVPIDTSAQHHFGSVRSLFTWDTCRWSWEPWGPQSVQRLFAKTHFNSKGRVEEQSGSCLSLRRVRVSCGPGPQQKKMSPSFWGSDITLLSEEISQLLLSYWSFLTLFWTEITC